MESSEQSPCRSFMTQILEYRTELGENCAAQGLFAVVDLRLAVRRHRSQLLGGQDTSILPWVCQRDIGWSEANAP